MRVALLKRYGHRLLMLPNYGVFDDVAFRLDGNRVTLLGEVTQLVLKTDAEGSVKGVEGIGQVVNEIDVLPLSPMDNQIRLAEFRVIYGDPSLSTLYGYRSTPPIHIIVKNGHVTLEGIVANEGDRNIAASGQIAFRAYFPSRMTCKWRRASLLARETLTILHLIENGLCSQ